MAAALGVKQAVTSPTFTLVNEYAGRLPLYHADLYRIRGPEELLGIGFDSYIESGGITVVEWAERAADLIPPHAVHVTLSARADPRERDIRVGPSRVRSAKC
jgi:tRNA threonylcarbamoyladenosine biosynthesis protein TsaE